jgi:hypothetical protein
MTLYDLCRLYDEGYENRARLEFPTPEMKRAMHRAGIRAVVEALRDKMGFDYRECGDCVRNDKLFDEILGSDGVDEKAAGGPTSNDGHVAGSLGAGQHGATPAADKREWRPVCIWEPDGRNLWFARCDKQMGHRSYPVAPTVCPSCGKPIKFKKGSE